MAGDFRASWSVAGGLATSLACRDFPHHRSSALKLALRHCQLDIWPSVLSRGFTNCLWRLYQFLEPLRIFELFAIALTKHSGLPAVDLSFLTHLISSQHLPFQIEYALSGYLM